ncbi:hypothetical protein GCM10022250_43740 [Flavobacterium chungbukense]|uniref:Uncharacterized protein n=1 Tax=Flavobacterium chungbukense TaxID=877464 RepID=A0ABP7YV18_9FLAO
MLASTGNKILEIVFLLFLYDLCSKIIIEASARTIKIILKIKCAFQLIFSKIPPHEHGTNEL